MTSVTSQALLHATPDSRVSQGDAVQDILNLEESRWSVGYDAMAGPMIAARNRTTAMSAGA
ncbi:hypothetical protein CKO35_03060 [Ectothiorhodospira shaposhnikovii]|nr:hypothetical protein [Ectothiorhodospira shaposhnikovii]